MPDMIMTVTGPAAPDSLGIFLPHEHVMSTFGADFARYPFYPVAEVWSRVIPYLRHLKTLGLGALADCTAAYFGRHPELLRRISVESGLSILTNTGYYAAASDRYVPPHAFAETPAQIAARWTREWQDGIDETGIRPGFIKTAVDEGPLSEIDARLVRAAALTHLQTGLLIQTHTGDNAPAATQILAILREEGVAPCGWVWVHAHQVRSAEPLLKAAEQGAWISLDNLTAENASHTLGLLRAFKHAGRLGQVLLSHDGDLYCRGDFRPFEFLFTNFLAQMRASGFSDEEIRLLTVSNPARAFTVQVRQA